MFEKPLSALLCHTSLNTKITLQVERLNDIIEDPVASTGLPYTLHGQISVVSVSRARTDIYVKRGHGSVPRRAVRWRFNPVQPHALTENGVAHVERGL